MNELCFEMHLQKSSDVGTSTCEVYFKCKDCDQTINMAKHKKKHVCHEVYCKTCKDFVNEDHQSYMLPVDVKGGGELPKEKQSEGKRTISVHLFFILSVHKTMLLNVSKVALKERMVNAYIVRSLGVEHFNTDLIYALYMCVGYACKVQ